MKLKRPLVVLLTTAIMISSFNGTLPGVVDHNHADESPDVVNTAYNIKSTNTLADYLMNAVQEEQKKSSELDNTDPDSHHSILSVEFDKTTGKLTMESAQSKESTAVIKFWDDSTKEDVLTSEIKVAAGENIYTDTMISLEALPEYFIISVQLVDESKKPLSVIFKMNKYCREMQEILAADIHDFPAEQVVNFDENEDTNFLVLSKDTIIAQSNEEENVLVSADYDQGVYIFDSADDTVGSLEKGDLFYIQPTPTDVIALSVDSVEENSDQTIVRGDSDNIDEMFDFIKFEGKSDTSDAVVAESEDDVDCSYEENEEHPDGALVFDPDCLSDKIVNTMSASALMGNVGASEDSEGRFGAASGNGIKFSQEFALNNDESIKVTPSLSLAFNLKFDFYKKGFYIDMECKVEAPITLGITIKVKEDLFKDIPPELAVPLICIDIPTAIPGLYVKIDPKLCFEVTGELSINYSVTPSFGFKFNSDEGFDLINDKAMDSSKITVQAKGTAFIGINFNPSCVIFHEKLLSFTIDAKAGLEVTGTLDVLEFDGKNASGTVFKCYDTSQKTKHTCDSCIKGDSNLLFSVDASITVFTKKIKIDLPLTLRIHAVDWYLSINNEALLSAAALPANWLSAASNVRFGLGTCPNIAYQTTFNVKNNNAYLQNATINVDGIENTTDSNGQSIVYCKNGSHSYSVSVNGTQVCTGSFTIHNAPKSLDVVFSSKVDGSGVPVTDVNGNPVLNPENTSDNDGDVVTTPAPKINIITTAPSKQTPKKVASRSSAYKLGDNITGILYEDGYLFISGSGEMYNFNDSPFRNSRINIKEVIIENISPEDDLIITNIGNCIFSGCSGLQKINIPDTITSIGNYAFYGCGSVPFTNIPKNVQSIGAYAFSGCTASTFTEAFPSALKTIAEGAFINTGVTAVNIPDTIDTVGNYAFSDCRSLKTATIGNVKEIGNAMFNQCTAIERVTLPYAGNTFAAAETAGNSIFVAGLLFRDEVFDKTYTADYGGFNYSIPNSLKTIKISSGTRVPRYAFCNLKVPVIILPDTVTTIEEYAFYGCSTLPGITFPKSLQTIKDYAFSECATFTFKEAFPSSLKTIGSYAFNGCSALKDINIPATIDTIGNYAFNNCQSIKTVTIGNVKKIGAAMFNKCTAIESVTLPYAGNTLAAAETAGNNIFVASLLFGENVTGKTYYVYFNGYYYYIPNCLKTIKITNGTRVPGYAFYNLNVPEIILPDTVTTIGNHAFQGCSTLPGITFPKSLQTIEDYAFSECTAFTFKESFPSSLKTIGSYAFDGCDALKEIYIPDTIDTVGNCVFNNCQSIKTATIGNVKSIGNALFNKCTAIESITLPYAGNTLAAAETAGNNIFVGVLLFGDKVASKTYPTNYNRGIYYIPNCLKTIKITNGTRVPGYAFCNLKVPEIILPDTVTTISNYAFYSCSILTGITFPKSLQTIEDYAFSECTAFTFKEELPSSLKTIGSYAFNGCNSLKEINIPDTIETVGSCAFNNCQSIKTVTIGNVKSIGNAMFNKCTAIESVTLPYAGNTLAAAETAGNNIFVAALLFSDYVSNKTYPSYYGRSNYYIPNTLKTITIKSGTRVPNYAFSNLKSLTSITLPKTITSVGIYAFTGCTNNANVFFSGDAPSFGDKALDNARVNVYYPGNNKTWDAVVKNSNFSYVTWTSITPLAITSQPKNVSAAINAPVEIKVTATGNNLKYQWQYSKNGGNTWIDSANKTTVYNTEALASRNGYCYRCIITDIYGNKVTSSYAKLTVKIPLAITSQPKSVSASVGATVQIKVSATGNNLKYQWQYSKDGGNTWIDSANKTTVYSTEALASRNGYCYRCIITDAYGNKITSSYAKLTVKTPLAITLQPKSVTTSVNSAVEIKVAATGDNLKYQWQYSKDSGKTWNDSVNKTAVYSTEALTYRNGYCYRCVITDAYSNKVTSSFAKLTIIPITITSQPKNVSASVNELVEIKVVAIGDNLKYQWQYSKDSGKTWIDSANKTAVYSTQALDSRNNYCYRCIITDEHGNKVTSSYAKLTIKTPLAIILQPKNVSAAVNATVQFNVAATGDSLKYQWQYSKDGGKTWIDSANKTAVYSTEALASRNGYCYRCIITDAYGNKVTSSYAKLTVKTSTPLAITSQPQNVTASVDAAVEIKVAATGDSLKYQWQYSKDGGKTWIDSANKTAVYSTEALASRNGYCYRCIITDANGNKVTSSYAKLTVKVPLAITLQPVNVSATLDSSVEIKVVATGDDVKYQWQYSMNDGNTWGESTNKTDAYTTTAESHRNGYCYRCIVTDAYGNSVTSSSSKLTIVPIAITSQPENVTASVDAAVEIKVEATGDDLKYQWQYSKDGGKTWIDSANKTAVYNTEALASRNGYCYRCIVTDSHDNSVESASAKLTVNN